jgi:hypothetical protein
VDLARTLGEFRDYYNARRVHRSLGGTPSAQRTDGSAAAPAALDHSFGGSIVVVSFRYRLRRE